MRTHADIDRRSLLLARAVAQRIDDDASRQGLERARQVCARWRAQSDSPAIQEWAAILAAPWEEVRPILLEESERGQRLRQSSPFCGVLTPRKRWQLYREFGDGTQ